MFQGNTLQLHALGDGLAELRFDRAGESVNKLDRLALDELNRALCLVREDRTVTGLLITSGKDSFIVGADIFEFTDLFGMAEDEIAIHNAGQSAVITALADLPVPTVVAVNGLALGGGLELALAADVRMLSDSARIGLPEVGLGIFPGFGGTVRLPRLIGVEAALQWIMSGTPRKADDALRAGAVDAVVPPPELREAALERLHGLVASPDWSERRKEALSPVVRAGEDLAPIFAAAKAKARKTGPHLPASLAVVELIESAAGVDRDAALALEARAFAHIARTPAARALVAVFINDQAVKKTTKQQTRAARPVSRAAVLGAGIMGGGIAYQSAVCGIPVIMKDIAQSALDLGMTQAGALLAKRVETGALSSAKADGILASIRPGLTYDGIAEADVIVEAVVENIAIKRAVLAELEEHIRPDAVVATNTSSLLVADLARDLEWPENFVGMHFFNPVHRMPLVEVIQGPHTSPEAVATIVGYASAMGKTPVVVRDCPGFLVNRILAANVLGFLRLIHDGADFLRIDAAMEGFGWPMGPAWLQDVIGMDTSRHVIEVIAAGYPERMRVEFATALDVMVESKRFGQKSGAGFYRYEADAAGHQRKVVDPDVGALLATVQPGGSRIISDEEIVQRTMLPMILETARCLEDGVVGSAAEADMALILGIGFPRHLGGALHYADELGAKTIMEWCDRYANLGPLYHPTPRMRRLAVDGAGWANLVQRPGAL
ncbi:fatty acid oxidation complex subunit alpha FadB [Azospirillum sp. B510]|uniref:fatty acid oxidation complex subunit alpha FadB n=1 Tax=Azospirillum sp. (strain B510) TaxID=137722 RepID=UPI0002DE25E7|nr:fatty acid oxidation complex subunit alpha FadB [Azospirillum sp. B510]